MERGPGFIGLFLSVTTDPSSFCCVVPLGLIILRGIRGREDWKGPDSPNESRAWSVPALSRGPPLTALTTALRGGGSVPVLQVKTLRFAGAGGGGAWPRAHSGKPENTPRTLAFKANALISSPHTVPTLSYTCGN